MIVLLNSFINISANNQPSLSSTGERIDSITNNHNNDSVMISYDDLRLVNAKFVELDYTKKKLDNYQQIVSNDSIIIRSCENEKLEIERKCKALKVTTITFGATTFVGILTIVIMSLCK